MDFTPSSFEMDARILNTVATMLYTTDSRSALAQAGYKGYDYRKRLHASFFHEKEQGIFETSTLKKSKMQKNMQESNAQSRLHFKITGPYNVIGTKSDKSRQWSLTITVFIDRCTKE